MGLWTRKQTPGFRRAYGLSPWTPRKPRRPVTRARIRVQCLRWNQETFKALQELVEASALNMPDLGAEGFKILGTHHDHPTRSVGFAIVYRGTDTWPKEKP